MISYGRERAFSTVYLLRKFTCEQGRTQGFGRKEGGWGVKLGLKEFAQKNSIQTLASTRNNLMILNGEFFCFYF